jgi:dynein heavy chain 1, cytosolic
MLKTPEVMMVFEIMALLRRQFIIMKFDNDNDIEPKLKTAREYNNFLKEIPIQQMLEAETINDMSAVTAKVFAALRKVMQ